METFDFVISGTVVTWIRGRGTSRVASELLAAQREAEVTAPLVTSAQKRITDLPDRDARSLRPNVCEAMQPPFFHC